MTKSQNTKNEQLTEQWKKGELPSGEYYIIDDLGLHTTDRYYPSHGFGAELPQAVLAPVPSYDEWKGKDDALTALLAEYGKLTKELQDEKEKHMTRPSLRSPADEMVIEKQVWESTLHRSMVLQAENEQLKELLKEVKDYLPEYETSMDILAKIDEALR